MTTVATIVEHSWLSKRRAGRPMGLPTTACSNPPEQTDTNQSLNAKIIEIAIQRSSSSMAWWRRSQEGRLLSILKFAASRWRHGPIVTACKINPGDVTPQAGSVVADVSLKCYAGLRQDRAHDPLTRWKAARGLVWPYTVALVTEEARMLARVVRLTSRHPLPLPTVPSVQTNRPSCSVAALKAGTDRATLRSSAP